MQLHELSIVPSRKNLPGVLRDIIGPLKQVPVFIELLSPARRNFLLIKPPRNAKLRLCEGIVIPADAADDRNLVADERITFQPMPANFPDSPRKFVLE